VLGLSKSYQKLAAAASKGENAELVFRVSNSGTPENPQLAISAFEGDPHVYVAGVPPGSLAPAATRVL
jgi:hypothetical protein